MSFWFFLSVFFFYFEQKLRKLGKTEKLCVIYLFIFIFCESVEFSFKNFRLELWSGGQNRFFICWEIGGQMHLHNLELFMLDAGIVPFKGYLS